MDEKLRALLDEIPEKPPRSKLEPHLEVIRELRLKGRTYQEIADFFAEHLKVKVAASTIFAFIKVRARRRQQRPPVELPSEARAIAGATAAAAAATASVGGATHEGDEVRARIEALKRKPPPEKPDKKLRFEYNENEPLQLRPRTKQKE